ncbi:MAG: DUF4112 domain-containing protein [Nitrospira sp.]|nr:MAG: DUF4112 domain-containing protein [Nitrospira sp.]
MVANPSPDSSETDLRRQALVEAAELLAKVLDTTVRIPGTSLYLGLDPLIGLIPGIGDVLANLIGTVILGMAARLEVPRIVIIRMSLNLLINGVVGAVPILGDLFSVWFRSNSRNADLLRQAATQSARPTHADWIYVVGIIGGTVALLLGLVAFVLWMAVSLWSRFAGIP